MNIYHAEMTDLFCGDLNYSYVARFKIHANTMRGAISKLSRHAGMRFRAEFADSEDAVYHSTTRLTGVSISVCDPENDWDEWQYTVPRTEI